MTVLTTLGDGAVFGELSILNIQGNKTGNRRTANVRSIGYSDIFVLQKQDLWEVLQDYPDARERLIERGTAILRKDNLIDEEALSRGRRDHESLMARSEKLTQGLQQLNEHFTQLLIGFTETQVKLKQRIIRLEAAISGLSPWESTLSPGLDHRASASPLPHLASSSPLAQAHLDAHAARLHSSGGGSGMQRSVSVRVTPSSAHSSL